MRKSERGFAVIDMLIAIGLSAMVTAGAGMTMVQLLKVTESSGDHALVVRQAQNMGVAISRDLTMANALAIGDDGGTADIEFISIDSREWETGNARQISYIWVNGPDSTKKLMRKQVLRDRNGAQIGASSTTLIADSISSANMTQQTGGWILNIQTRSDQKTTQRTYKIIKRVET
ncbi:MAG: hypothetical protein HY665_08945 [Chloroflexi bacterium]|nr:hypothetical protein [Chloroflexota bacterium]